MSSGKQVQNTGTNNQGNDYRAYTDGGYSYSNKDGVGNTESTYYDTGKGHAFYDNPKAGYSFHDNKNEGYRTYHEKAKK